MTAPYVTTLEPDHSDTDAVAFDPDMVCANADPFCDGSLIERRTAGGETIFLCEAHTAANDFFMSGIVPYLRSLPATEPARKAALA